MWSALKLCTELNMFGTDISLKIKILSGSYLVCVVVLYSGSDSIFSYSVNFSFVYNPRLM